jgi:hypothetical protein
VIGASPVAFGRRHCRSVDVDCAIAAALSRGLGSQLGEILPKLLAKHGRLLGVGRSDRARRR